MPWLFHEITKMVVRQELIHPELDLINVNGTPENTFPEDYKDETGSVQNYSY